MKKTISAFLTSVLIVIAILSSVSLSVSAASSNKDNVFYRLKNDLGISTAAACGIMANIERESEFNSKNVHIDSNGLLSGGLCMWNGGRFKNLKSFCSNNGYDYLSIEGQIKYLKHELSSNYYKHIYNYLKNVSNNSDGAYDAAYYWCYYFEIPSNRHSSAQNRGRIASSSYWPTYSKKVIRQSLKAPKLKSSSNGKTLDIQKNDVKLSWTSSGSSCKGYTVQICKLSNGKYNWSKAKSIKLSANKKSAAVDLSKYGTGSFAIRVAAKNGDKTVTSNLIKYKVTCKDHIYKTKVTERPTAKKEGTRTFTCTKCGNVVKQKVSKTTTAKVIPSVGNIEITAGTKCITLNVAKVKNAVGYTIYQKKGNDYVRVAALTKNAGKVKISSLSSGKVYSFRVYAFADRAGKGCVSKAKDFTAATKTAPPKITSAKSTKTGCVELKRNAVSGADCYTLFGKKSSADKYERIGTYSKADNKIIIKGLKSGTTYCFKLSAVNVCSGNRTGSHCSNAIKVKVK